MSTIRLTSDAVLFAKHDDRLFLLMIERGWDPYAGKWALPGGHVDGDEDFADAAARELVEETGLTMPAGAELVGVYGTAGRDPRGRYVSWAYMSVLDHLPTPHAADDARAARWVPLAEVITDLESLAFDHDRIVIDALARLGIVLRFGNVMKMTNRLEPGDVVTRDHPEFSPTWWRIDSPAGTDDAGVMHFAAECVGSPDAALIGQCGLFSHPGNRTAYLKH
ncbi:NUDIX domain-containing protein [Saccharothrix sp. Mg75]|uniref:NUDIX domain-containing protein n=1 Tax=Saccharothrix sp. Mg75 TaxID=3445357 RepID=UPI003EE90E4B